MVTAQRPQRPQTAPRDEAQDIGKRGGSGVESVNLLDHGGLSQLFGKRGVGTGKSAARRLPLDEMLSISKDCRRVASCRFL